MTLPHIEEYCCYEMVPGEKKYKKIYIIINIYLKNATSQPQPLVDTLAHPYLPNALNT